MFAAVPYCLELAGARRIETDPAVIVAFRPKWSAGADCHAFDGRRRGHFPLS
jgi:hypothetical protein